MAATAACSRVNYGERIAQQVYTFQIRCIFVLGQVGILHTAEVTLLLTVRSSSAGACKDTLQPCSHGAY
jgi:hypothetical protein